MITEDIKIQTNGRPIEAFVMYGKPKPDKAFLILPGKGYTINHFLLDFLWRMAAEAGFYSIKAEYRGYTYRHLDEPYDHESAIEDAGYILDYLEGCGFSPDRIVLCGKSLGTIALAGIVVKRGLNLDKAILLTPVLYYQKDSEIFPVWQQYKEKISQSFLVFGDNDPYCDLDTAKKHFPDDIIKCYPGADHGLHIESNYEETIEIKRDTITRTKNILHEI